MSNIVPASEGFVSPEVFAIAVKEIREVLEPLMDKQIDINDGITMGIQALGAIEVVKALPSEHRLVIVGAAIAQILAEIGQDLVVVFPEEIPGMPA